MKVTNGQLTEIFMKALNSKAIIFSVILASSAIVNADEIGQLKGKIDPQIAATQQNQAINGSPQEASVSQVSTSVVVVPATKASDPAPLPSTDLGQYKKAETYIDSNLVLSRSKAISDKKNDLELAKLRLEEASIENQIAELDNKTKGHGSVGGDKGSDSSQSEELVSLRSEFEILKSKMTSNQIAKAQNEIYVTKIFGLDGDFIATIYHNNNVYKKHAGEVIVPGIVVDKIDINGIVIKQGGKLKTISLTDSKSAYDKAFDKKSVDYSLPAGMGAILSAPDNAPRAKKM
jgi:hypothetical protein